MLLFMVLVLVCSAVYANTESQAAGSPVIAFLFLFLGGYVVGFIPTRISYIDEIWPILRTKEASTY